MPDDEYNKIAESPEKRLDKLFNHAFETNDPTMLDWIAIKFELKELRKLKKSLTDPNLK